MAGAAGRAILDYGGMHKTQRAFNRRSTVRDFHNKFFGAACMHARTCSAYAVSITNSRALGNLRRDRYRRSLRLILTSRRCPPRENSEKRRFCRSRYLIAETRNLSSFEREIERKQIKALATRLLDGENSQEFTQAGQSCN